MDQHIAYLSIGSNKGDKKKNLEKAILLLKDHDKMDVLAVSSFYQTQPQNFTDQDWFVNAALKISTVFDPADLMAELKNLETRLDKTGKVFRFGPRVIDLDIIYYDDVALKTDMLEIPHPRMHERCFVLIPMCDIAGTKIHPVFKKTPAQLLKNMEKQEAQEVILLDEEA